MWSLIVAVAFFLIAAVIANLVLYKPNNPGTVTRRIWFWVLCAATGVVGFVINYIIGSAITVPSVQSSYFMHAGIAAGVSVVAYIAVGFIVSKMLPTSKVGTWF